MKKAVTHTLALKYTMVMDAAICGLKSFKVQVLTLQTTTPTLLTNNFCLKFDKKVE